MDKVTENALWKLVVGIAVPLTIEESSPIYGAVMDLEEWRSDYCLFQQSDSTDPSDDCKLQLREAFTSLVSALSPEIARTLKAFLKRFKERNSNTQSNSLFNMEDISTYSTHAGGSRGAVTALNGDLEQEKVDDLLESMLSKTQSGGLFSTITWKKDGFSHSLKVEEKKPPQSMYKLVCYKDYSKVIGANPKEMWKAADLSITIYTNQSDQELITKAVNTLKLVASKRIKRLQDKEVTAKNRRVPEDEDDEELNGRGRHRDE